MAENRCPNCSSLMPEGFRFCTACGTPLIAAPAQTAEPVVIAAPVGQAPVQLPVEVEEIVSVPAVEEEPVVQEETAVEVDAVAENTVSAEEIEPGPDEPVQVFFPRSVDVLAAEETAEAHSDIPEAIENEQPAAPEYAPMTSPEMSAPPAHTLAQWQEQYVPTQPVYEAPVYTQPIAPMEPAMEEQPPAPEVHSPAQKLTGKEKRAAKKAANAAAAAAVKGTKYEPVKTWGYVANYFLMSIPVLNIILLIVWAFGGCRKIGRRNWARSLFVIALLNILFTALVIGGFVFTLKQLGLDLEALAEGDFTQLEQLVEYLAIKYIEPALEEYGPQIEQYIG